MVSSTLCTASAGVVVPISLVLGFVVVPMVTSCWRCQRSLDGSVSVPQKGKRLRGSGSRRGGDGDVLTGSGVYLALADRSCGRVATDWSSGFAGGASYARGDRGEAQGALDSTGPGSNQL